MGFNIFLFCDTIIIGGSMKILRNEEKLRFITISAVCLIAIVVGLLTYGENNVNDLDSSKLIGGDSSIAGKVKEYYNYYGLIDFDTLLEWKIEKTTKIKDNLYVLEGYYICSDLAPSCVYQESYGARRKDDSYQYVIYVTTDEDNEIVRLSSIVREESKLKNMIYDYFESSNLVDYTDTIKWSITNEKLITDSNYKVYEFDGVYDCISDNDDCIKLQDNNKKYVNGYKFKIYGTFVEKDNTLELVGISKTI